MHELVVLAARIGLLQRVGCGRGGKGSRALGQNVIGGLHPLPTVVPVHCKVAAGDRSDLTRAQFFTECLQGLQRRGRALGRGIAAIQERVQIDFFQARPRRHFQHGVDVVLVAVYPARGEQPQNMQRAVVGERGLYGIAQRGIVEEAAVLYIHVDAADVLIHHTARADVQVSDFGIAHLLAR